MEGIVSEYLYDPGKALISMVGRLQKLQTLPRKEDRQSSVSLRVPSNCYSWTLHRFSLVPAAAVLHLLATTAHVTCCLHVW